MNCRSRRINGLSSDWIRHARPSSSRAIVVTSVVAFALTGGCSGNGSHRDLGREVLESLSARERVALADKRVDFGEYESASRAEYDCLVALGVEVDPFELGKNGTYSFGWTTFDKSDSEVEAIEAQANACDAEVDAIGAVYILQHGATENELRNAEKQFRSCVGDLGLGGATTDSVGALAVELQGRVEAGSISRSAGENCIDIIEAVDMRPLPGLDEALEELDL